MAEGDVKPPATLGRDHSPRKKSHKTAWIIGGVAVVGVIGAVLFLRKKSSSSTSSSSTGVSNAGSPTITQRIIRATTGPTGQSLYSDLFNQIQTLGNQINTLKTKVESANNAQTATTNPAGAQTTSNFGKTLQTAPDYSSFGYSGKFYTPITSYSQTLADIQAGQSAYFKTGTKPVKITSATEYKSLEHTGTHRYPQYTSFRLA